MSRKMIPVEESFTAWRKQPEYEKAYNDLEDEFSLAAAMIEARYSGVGVSHQRIVSIDGNIVSIRSPVLFDGARALVPSRNRIRVQP